MKRLGRNSLVACALALTASVIMIGGGEGTAHAAPSRCSTSFLVITCAKNTTWITAAGEPRQVHYQTPLGSPPAGGWPTVLMFQGSLFSGELNWTGYPGMPFGGYYQVQVVRNLLDNGYAVITPEAHLNGATFWDTNNPLFANNWSGSPDDQLMQLIFQRVDGGQFGALNGSKLFATGISSGGYMSSRMTLAYPERFKAVAIQSASYATCSGPLCVVPSSLPTTHAPTLFLHGVLDPVVPIATMYWYRDSLQANGTTTRVKTHLFATHEWISAAPGEVLGWFNQYR